MPMPLGGFVPRRSPQTRLAGATVDRSNRIERVTKTIFERKSGETFRLIVEYDRYWEIKLGKETGRILREDFLRVVERRKVEPCSQPIWSR